MKTVYTIFHASLLSLALLMSGCNSDENQKQPDEDAGIMKFEVYYPSSSSPQSRVTDNHFDANDEVGIFVSESGKPLEVAGNYVNNASLLYDGNAWKPVRPIYWDDGTYDVFAYYPYASPVNSVDDYSFTVAADQSVPGTNGLMGGYESSDFLFASARGQQASVDPVKLQFRHVMSKLVVRLVKGEDFEGELPDEAEVYVHNTVPSATIDLNVGIATKYAYGKEQTIRMFSLGDHKYAAILVPQRLTNRRPLIEVIMKGVSYLVESTFVFKPGIQHTISVVVDKNPEQVKIEIGGEVEDWE